ncbi:ABC transporter ATP-binding protein [Alkalicoccobacillus porphyridii]|uniref:ABC transporter ATP-binding protein n=1 Tax=Alkalicoccobacillus porphyridii TaxID=2597270 RepID=A0A553ZV44_9BACI|nr:ABC transporter ATP-binding protein [Alkalicoccobacillus porphyridii]TSB45327.1 ABC transporter ATP-binding protein [Alkalicoccobacillus porphyridii]
MLIVESKGLIKRYGNERVLDHAELTIKEGEIVGLLGPNGAGKTTLIHALCGLVTIDAGTIHLFGKELTGNLTNIKERIGLVTQELTIFEELTAKENLTFFGGLYGLRGETLQQRIEDALDFVGLQSQAKKQPKTFSGGMKRRLNIACSLIHQPKLLIMDEPTVGIDPQSRNHILEAVRKLQKQGTTILYSTHYMEELQAIASRVVIMDQGHIITEGTIKDLIATIQHEEKINLEVAAASGDLLSKLQQLEGVKQVISEGNNLQIISRLGAGNLDRTLTLAKEAGGVLSISAEKPTLEDVFLTLTGKHLRDGEEYHE